MTERANGRSTGCLWYLAGPVLALGAVVLGAKTVASRWDSCPFGMDAPTRAGVVLSVPIAWIGMSVVLFLLQLALAAWLPEGIDREVRWVVLVVAVLVLFVLYLGGMGSPDTDAYGECLGG